MHDVYRRRSGSGFGESAAVFAGYYCLYGERISGLFSGTSDFCAILAAGDDGWLYGGDGGRLFGTFIAVCDGECDQRKFFRTRTGIEYGFDFMGFRGFIYCDVCGMFGGGGAGGEIGAEVFLCTIVVVEVSGVNYRW